jgi:hypothetical protein
MTMKYLVEEIQSSDNLTAGIKQFRYFFKSLNLSKIGKKHGFYKRSGHSPVRILLEIVKLVFNGLTLFQANNSKSSPLQKDMVHRLLKRPEIDWYQWYGEVAWQAASNAFPAIGTQQTNDVLILDDTPFARPRSHNVELLAHFWDHSKKRYIQGYQNVVLAVSDGKSTLPLDFRLSAGNKLVNPQAQQSLPAGTPAAQRRAQARLTKLELAKEMIGQAVERGYSGSYLLLDSWYALSCFITEIHRKHHLHMIGQVRSNFRVRYKGYYLSVAALYKLLKKRPGRGKVAALVAAELKSGVKVQVLFIRHGKGTGKWMALVTTDLALDPESIIQLYGRRWSIEVLFKMNKSYLRMTREFQSRSFDSMVAQVVISFLRYLYLSWAEYLQTDDRTFGALFLRELEESSGIQYQRALMEIVEELFKFLEKLPEHFQATLRDMVEIIRKTVEEVLMVRALLKCDS